MNLLGWTAAIGVLFLLVSLASGWIRDLPMTTFSIYLAAGVAAGPWFLNLLDIDFAALAPAIAGITEIALAVSLFLTGLKLRIAFSDPGWRTAMRLALPAMVLTVAGIGALMHWAFALPWPLALLVGAILAPTDPVLASMVAVGDASDRDRLRVALSGEAGLNDGTALPFVMLALLLLHGSSSATDIGKWFAWDFGWALIGGLGIGFALGWIIGWFGVRLKTASGDVAPSDLLALALIALAYAAAAAVSASGFLAAFAAGLGLRHVELYVVNRHPRAQDDDGDAPQASLRPPAELQVNQNRRDHEDAKMPVTSMGLVVADALDFGQTVERLIAAALVFLLGVAFANYWHADGLLLAVALFLVVRPLAVYLSTVGSALPLPRRLMIGWFGIRGIGSLNYLAYAATHGLDPSQVSLVTGYVITTVALSVLIHGITTPPLMRWRQARLPQRDAAGERR